MADALTKEDAVPFRIPPGIRMVRLNAETGQLARPGDTKVFLEAFKPGTEPTGREVVLDGGYDPSTGSTQASGAGGLYSAPLPDGYRHPGQAPAGSAGREPCRGHVGREACR